jgi:UDP:flavonoid glycosyltransferase YjiC (YdhE family)
MRVLQVIWDGGGNTPPQLAIARSLAARGHEVRMLAHACQRERVEATGATFVPYRHAPEADSSDPETDLLRDWEARTPLGAFARLRDNLMYGPALRFARDVIDELDEHPAEVVVWDYLLLGAGLGAERAGVPDAGVIHHIYPLPAPGVPPFGQGFAPAGGPLGRLRDAALGPVLRRPFAPGLKVLNAARAELGLPPFDSPFGQLLRSDRLLVLTSAALDFAGRAPLPPNVRYTGAVTGGAGTAGWDSPWAADDPRPLVLVSFSTTFMDQAGLLGRAVHALSGLPVRALVTTGDAVDPARLPAADNVAVRKFVPHAAVLPEASLAITHAGMGTVHEALAAGVPLVCMPGGRDQHDIAARVEFAGVGVRIGQGASAKKLREVVERALADRSLTDAARRMAASFAREDGATRAVEEIESVIGRA